MTKFRNHYENLHVSQNAPLCVIKSAYKTLCQNYHPDKNIGNPQAHQIMQIINAAYAVLSNPRKRHEHDQWIADKKTGFKSAKSSTTFKKESVYAEANQNIDLNNAATIHDGMHTKNVDSFYLSPIQLTNNFHNWIA
jgi:DnaJ-class molecular chaperone